MRKFLAILFLTLGAFAGVASAQQKLQSMPGEVTAINQASNQLTIKTKDGEASVTLDAKTDFKRIAPDKLSDPASAVASNLSEISVGDRLVVVGILSEDKKTVALTRRIYLVTQADYAKQQAADRAKWTTRGIAGRVTAINPTTKEITVSARGGINGDRNVTVAAAEKTVFRRYAPNSVSYSEAKIGSIGDVKVGDQLRAYGEKSADGARLTAEEVVSGSFRMVAGTITAVDAAKGEVMIRDAQTKAPVTIVVGSTALLRRFPPEMAQRFAMMQAARQSGQMPPAMGGTGQGGQMGQQRPANQPGQMPPGERPQQQGGMSGARQGGGMMRGGGGDVDEMLERLPALTLAELKVGDAVAASSTGGTDRVTAIKFVAGVEPFLNPPQMPSAGGGQGRPQQSAPSFSIPGLDGFGTP